MRLEEASRVVDSAYGSELILDRHGCDEKRFNRASIDEYFTRLCKLIDMEKIEVHFWDDIDVPSGGTAETPAY
jgi:hypothetical protein